MSKRINNVDSRKPMLNTLRHKFIKNFIKTTNFRILYFLFIESYFILKEIQYFSKKKKPPLSLCGSGVDEVDAFYHFYELKDSNLNPSVGEGHNSDKTGEEKIEQIKPEGVNNYSDYGLHSCNPFTCINFLFHA